MRPRRFAPFTLAVLLVGVGAAFSFAACGNGGGPGFQGDDGTSSSSSSGSSTGSSSGSGSGGTTSSSGTAAGSSGSHPSSGSSSSSGGHPSSGSSSGSGSSASSSGADASDDAPPPPPPYDGGPQACGNTSSCSLKTSTCCLDEIPNLSTCIPHGQNCPSLTAAFSCLGAVDCDTGSVCCGVATMINATSGTASTSCQAVAPGQCPPTTATQSMGGAQLCATAAECASGQDCILQKCVGGANLRLCGLHPDAPFNCTMQ
jgi:hypothetical protein